jgi:predicted double-glycine peptidase
LRASLCVVALLLVCARAQAQPAAAPLSLLDVPFISQSEALCGGAAAAMVLRYWGARGLTAESFAHLLDRSVSGIATAALVGDLRSRGWNATPVAGTAESIDAELSRGRPVLTLIEDRPGTFHYIVIVGTSAGAVVFHDPARSPFRVMSRTEFSRRWNPAGRWMAVVLPGASPREGAAGAAATLIQPSQPCDRLVATGIERAQANDLAAAEQLLGEALTCPGSAPLRELAGVRLLQQRWIEAAELSSAALALDPRDEYAWRVMATSRFLRNDPLAALDAWNAVNEPRLDLVTVDGLERTRQRVVEQLMRLVPERVLTRRDLNLAARRLEQLPSAVATRLDYVPRPGGQAEVRARIAERPVVPRGPWSYAAMGLAAATSQELRMQTGSLSGAGESIAGMWRFWPNRRRVGLDMQAPAPWGGVWGVGAFNERQAFDLGGLEAARRTAAAVNATDWLAPGIQLSVRGGVDRWRQEGTFASLGTSLHLPGERERINGRVDLDLWTGTRSFALADASIQLRSSADREGRVLLGRVGMAVASSGVPLDVWPAGDTGHARATLLRAHPVLNDGRLETGRLGRSLVSGTAEAQRWWRVRQILQVGAAAFADAAWTARRFDGPARGDIDLGIGARLAATPLRGVVRIDLAKGLRDGSTAVSVLYEP